MEKITTKTEIFKKGQKSYTSSNFFLKSSAYSSNLNSNQKSINTKKFNIFRPSNFTDQILKSINLIRSDPLSYVAKLKMYKEKVGDGVPTKLFINGHELVLKEGKTVFNDLINQLKQTKKLQKIHSLPEIKNSSENYLRKLQIFEGIEKSFPSLRDRISTYGNALGQLAELIDYGSEDVDYLILKLLLSDENPVRTNRNILLSQNLKYCGISTSIFPSKKIVTLMQFCELFFSFQENIPQCILENYKENQVISKLNSSKLNKFNFKENEHETKHRRTASTAIFSSLNSGNFAFNSDQSEKYLTQSLKVNRSKDLYESPKDLKLTQTKSPDCVSMINIRTNTFKEKNFNVIDQDIEKVHYNKRPLSSDKYLVKKVVYYKDGSLDEWIYKENII